MKLSALSRRILGAVANGGHLTVPRSALNVYTLDHGGYGQRCYNAATVERLIRAGLLYIGGRTVALTVEGKRVVQELREADCPHIQGYALPPVPKREQQAWEREQRKREFQARSRAFRG